MSIGGGVTDIVGKAVIVHKDADDYTTQPTGNSGARVACGVIRKTLMRIAIAARPLAVPCARRVSLGGSDLVSPPRSAGCSGIEPTSALPRAVQSGGRAAVPKNGAAPSAARSRSRSAATRSRSPRYFVELSPGPHSLYIHEIGNCSSPNAASAGPVWNAKAPADGDARRTCRSFVRHRGKCDARGPGDDLSVGTGAANDIIGHAVVVQQASIPIPKPEFGVPNGWLACGVIERIRAC